MATTDPSLRLVFFFFNDTSTTEIYTLSLHDALPISRTLATVTYSSPASLASLTERNYETRARSEEHTSELQSHSDLVCRLLLEKKKQGAIAKRLRKLVHDCYLIHARLPRIPSGKRSS